MKLLSLFFVLAVSFSVAKADQIQINQGSVRVTPFWFFSFSGQGGSVNASSAGFLISSTIPCLASGCFEGTSMSFNSSTSLMFWQDWGGIVTIGNDTRSVGDHSVNNGVTGNFSFSTAPVVLPFTTQSVVTFVVPFSGGGTSRLAGYPGVFDAGWSGTGWATVVLNHSGNSYSYRSISYDFTNVPEPSSILLICSGLLGIAVKLRRRY